MINPPKDVSLTRFVGHPPANREEIDRVQQQLSLHLPESYIEFMLARNGGEGFIGESYLALWRMEDLIAMNSAYHATEFAPKLFLFGSNGGDEAFGFDTHPESRAIVSIPFIPMDILDAKVVAPDFEAFLSTLFTS